jgi:hypothetical protein
LQTRCVNRPQERTLATSKLFRYGGIVASIVLIAFGAAPSSPGSKGRDRVHSDLAREQIVGTPDSSIPNQLVNAGAPARGRHALRRGGGGEGEATLHTLWWPPSKVNGRYLAAWLAVRDEEAVADRLPQSGGLAVQTDLHRDYIAS